MLKKPAFISPPSTNGWLCCHGISFAAEKGILDFVGIRNDVLIAV
jgi:hypothetical protein